MKDSNLAEKRNKNAKELGISDHLLQCDCPITFYDFIILASNSNKFNKRDKLVFNKTIKEFPLVLFDWACSAIEIQSLLNI